MAVPVARSPKTSRNSSGSSRLSIPALDAVLPAPGGLTTTLNRLSSRHGLHAATCSQRQIRAYHRSGLRRQWTAAGRTWGRTSEFVFKIGNGSLAALANGQRRLSACTLSVLDDQHGPSLLLVGEEPVPVVFPPGPGRFPFVTIRPIGSAEASMSQQSNKSGIGTRIELYAGGGPLRLADALRTGSGPGQSDQPIAIGIGRAAEADLVRLVWPDGVVQAEAHLAPGLHRIVETRPEVYW